MNATPDNALSNPEQFIADLQRQLDECKAARDEAIEQQTATAEVLQVINASPGDLAPVFDVIVEKAHILCGVENGSLWLYDGEKIRAVAVHAYSDAFAQRLRVGFPASGNPVVQALLDGARYVHIPDMAAVDHQSVREAVEHTGIRTFLGMPLRKDGVLLGVITFVCREIRFFTDKQILLLENFATQAVIAMENARLLTETREALEQQTATAEVLQVINSSPGDLAPVFYTVLEKALSFCAPALGLFWTCDGDHFSPMAVRGPAPFVAFYQGQHRLPAVPGSALFQNLSGKDLVTIVDLAEDALSQTGNPRRRAYLDLGGARSAISLALRKDDTLLGAIQVYRQEVRPFSDKEIALLQNFAAQAVIAMENARLLTETREALEQQTATAEILQVINRSPGNLTPVYDVILEKARSLCGVSIGGLMLYDGKQFRTVALHGLPKQFLEEALRPFPPGPPHERLIRGDRLLYEPDFQAVALQSGRHPASRALVEMGVRTALVVPLRKEGSLLGFIAANRLEVRPFSDKEIALLESFAAQAVIAMDNARLLDEIRQRQAELRVTFDNMGDGVAMFDAELRLAAWNTNFRKMLDLPETYLAERPGYKAYIRYLAARGEFSSDHIEAELSRRLEKPDRELRFERTRPDGRVIEVRRNAVPGGGFVLIYSDITERKAAEARLRAARDTAERALRELRAAQASLVHAEKMASLGQLTAGIAHEIRNPLNFVNNFAGLSVELLDELKEAVASHGDNERADIDETINMLRGNLEKIVEHGRRADGIVSGMLDHSRGSSMERRRIDLNALIEEALNLAYHGGRAQDQSFNITLERAYADAIAPIEVVPQDITRVCLNLFSNGFYAATKRQRKASDTNFKPTLKVSTRDLGEVVEIRVRDNGTGIPPEIKEKLFQPFFTTKPTGEGTGLGLSISWDIVTQQHGGTITVDSRPGEYTELTIRLPRNYRATRAEAAS